MFHPGAAPRGVAVLLHGLDDGPAQWSAMIQSVYDLGYDVFAPNLPGHGLRDANGNDVLSQIPGASGYEDWNRFADRVYELSKPSGQVTVVGLSAGGMLSLRLAERHAGELNADGRPIVQQVVAISPLLDLEGDFKLGEKKLRFGPLHVTNERAAELLGATESLFGQPIESYLRGQAVDMKGPNPPTAYGTRYVNQDIVLGLVRVADQTKLHGDRLRALPKGVELIVTMADDTVDPSTNLDFAKHIGAGTYVFPASAKVPHAMIYPPENPDATSVARVHDLLVERLSR
jgi:pimeloyl-ACP methyl ester carboxylesterase